MAKIIVIDCAPFTARPDTYMSKICIEADIPMVEAGLKFFGVWCFDYSNLNDEDWLKLRGVAKNRLSDYYAKGLIRYGNWGTEK